MAERFARERLRAVAQVGGQLVKEVPEVLFVCVHNAGRSQMAAALLDHHAEGRVHVRSAGSTPANEINPAVVAVGGRGRRRHVQGVPEATYHGSRRGGRRRCDDGMRRRLPGLPWDSIPGLGVARPRWQERRGRPPDPITPALHEACLLATRSTAASDNCSTRSQESKLARTERSVYRARGGYREPSDS